MPTRCCIQQCYDDTIHDRSSNPCSVMISNLSPYIVGISKQISAITNVPERRNHALDLGLVDRCPVHHALSVHLCRANLITRFDDRYAADFREKFQMEVPLFCK